MQQGFVVRSHVLSLFLIDLLEKSQVADETGPVIQYLYAKLSQPGRGPQQPLQMSKQTSLLAVEELQRAIFIPFGPNGPYKGKPSIAHPIWGEWPIFTLVNTFVFSNCLRRQEGVTWQWQTPRSFVCPPQTSKYCASATTESPQYKVPSRPFEIIYMYIYKNKIS